MKSKTYLVKYEAKENGRGKQVEVENNLIGLLIIGYWQIRQSSIYRYDVWLQGVG